jgi:hypothetical protein
MEFKDYKLFWLYIYNRMDYNKFRTLFDRANNTNFEPYYINEKWTEFNNNPAAFIMTHNKSFFGLIQESIRKENYQG